MMLIIGKTAQVKGYVKILQYFLNFSQNQKLSCKIKSVDKIKKKKKKSIRLCLLQVVLLNVWQMKAINYFIYLYILYCSHIRYVI